MIARAVTPVGHFGGAELVKVSCDDQESRMLTNSGCRLLKNDLRVDTLGRNETCEGFAGRLVPAARDPPLFLQRAHRSHESLNIRSTSPSFWLTRS